MRYGFCWWRFVVFTCSPESFWTFGWEPRDEFSTRFWALGLVVDYFRPLTP